jgi:hypothetical protein
LPAVDVFVCVDPAVEVAVQVTAGARHVIGLLPPTCKYNVPLILPGVLGGGGVEFPPPPVPPHARTMLKMNKAGTA